MPSGPEQLLQVTLLIVPMLVPDSPVPLAAEPVAVDEVHFSWVPVLVSVRTELVDVPVKVPPPDTVQVPAAFAGAAVNATAAMTADPATRALLVRVESL